MNPVVFSSQSLHRGTGLPPAAAKRLRPIALTGLMSALAVIACLAAPLSTFAQGKTETPAATQPGGDGVATARTHPNDPMLWDVEAMMEDAVQQISRRYNLTKEQEDYTRVFLKKRVREFLDKYETDVRELLQESINIRTGKVTEPSALADWAVRAMPVYDAATKAILDGNHEWGVILDEKQKETHEKDLRLMDANFKNVTGTLNRWAEGKGNSRESAGGSVGTDGTARPIGPIRQEIEDAWIAYVNQFINAYQLDEAKKISARDKIHKEQFDKAKLFREANKDKFKALETERRKIGALPVAERGKKLREISDRKHDLERPIYRLFVEMSRRLDTLPTSKQRAEVTEAAKKSLEALYKKMSGENDKSDKTEKEGDAGPSETKATPATQPSSDKPAAQPASEDKPVESPTTQKS